MYALKLFQNTILTIIEHIFAESDCSLIFISSINIKSIIFFKHPNRSNFINTVNNNIIEQVDNNNNNNVFI